MKKLLLSTFLSAACTSAMAGDTLKNFNPMTTVPTALTFSGSGSGYMTGHNSYNDEEWAEKYYISGSGKVLGLISYHTGKAGTSTHQSHYKVYDVDGKGLPNKKIASKSMLSTAVNISGKPTYIAFPVATNVKDSFFVSFGVDDYAHSSPGTLTLALMHAPAGTRPNSDTTKFGRNVVRWHDHDKIIWKDFFKENFTPVRTHFAIFPVMQSTTSISNYISNGSSTLYSLYPNPARDQIRLKLVCTVDAEINCSIIDMQGKTYRKWIINSKIGENNYVEEISDLASGNFIMIFETAEGNLAQQFTKQ